MSNNVARKCMASIASLVEYCDIFCFTFYHYCPYTFKHPSLQAFSLFLRGSGFPLLKQTKQINATLFPWLLFFTRTFSIWKTGGWFADAKNNNNNNNSSHKSKEKMVEREMWSIQKTWSNGSCIYDVITGTKCFYSTR